MSILHGTYTNGVIRLDGPADLAEGQKVVIQPKNPTDRLGCSEDEWDNSVEGIDDWLRWYGSLEPLMLTTAELAKIASAREEQKRFELESWDRQSVAFRENFE